jgi:hypothetical protein
MSSIIGTTYKRYVEVSNRVTSSYETGFGFSVDVYFPVNLPNPQSDGNYDDVNIFATHGAIWHTLVPDVSTTYYIPHLFKKDSMKSTEDSFDNFYDEADEQPYIETSHSKEIPIMSKVIVNIEETTVGFLVEKKTVKNGANGHMLLRMYLIPLVGEENEE